MKNDMRITYPLWMMWFIVLIAATVYLVGTTADFEYEEHKAIGMSLSFESNFVTFIIFTIIILVSLIVYFIQVYKQNRNFPDKKIKFFSSKPPEYMEDDELFQQVTRQATQKVYSFFATSIPVLAVLFMLTSIGKMWMILGVLFLGFMQYLIYYMEIKKYIGTE